jgi:release factor glutamine methyltransferase
VASDPITVDLALAQARQQGLERLDAQWLLCHVLTQTPSWLMAHGDAPLAADHAQSYGLLVARRALGEPLAYLVGEKEFYGLTLQVNPHVLVPRPDTETLVDWALSLIPEAQPSDAAEPMHVLDLGTGSGAIALAIQQHRPWVLVTASDASEAALRTAMDNAQRLQLPVRFVQGHWLAPWANGSASVRFDLIVSNPPYIADADPHLAQLGHEPLSALTAGPDGLRDLLTLVAQAPQHLFPGGWLLLEHGYDQHTAVQAVFKQAGFSHISTHHDVAGHPRCTGGKWLLDQANQCA